ncbi:MAG: hypothetical protein AMQ74_01989 [Candidatus Methanofastidiosum methylothiophilum]|uniref:Uncharacterized protein n=1 Tax=Candidatus Methanofastidiosum methylothiophilum TaxID=1705564 RepID=A0A150IH48_9EURY|nr:MAG: hypothetical protein AMQ74_01989 [Candidatus Methanofastidiosum methylthiophilus]
MERKFVDENELRKLIEGDEDTWKSFTVLVNLVGRNYPFYKDPERKVLERMVSKGIKTLDDAQSFIMNLYFAESKAGRVIKQARGYGGARG